MDLDFPSSSAPSGPLDAIIQAAGRCNRRGPRRGAGDRLCAADGACPRRLPDGDGSDPGAAGRRRRGPGGGAAEAYYRELYDTANTDERDIQRLRRAFDFPEVAARFR